MNLNICSWLALEKNVGTLIAIPLLLMCTNALCDTDKTLLMLANPDENKARILALRDSLDSQLVDSNIVVKIHHSNIPAETTYKNRAVIERILTEQDALGALWIDRGKFNLLIFFDNERSFFEKALPQKPVQWELKCDAVSSVVRALLGPWLEKTETCRPEPSHAEKKQEKVQKRNPESPKPDVENFKEKKTTPLRTGFYAGWSPSIISSKSLTVSSFSAGVYLRPVSQITLSGSAGLATLEKRGFSMYSIPLGISLLGQLGLSTINPGAEISFMANLVKTGSNRAETKDHSEIYIGTGFHLVLFLLIGNGFEVLLKSGIDIYSRSNRYKDNKGLLFKFNGIHGKLFLGAVLWF